MLGRAAKASIGTTPNLDISIGNKLANIRRQIEQAGCALRLLTPDSSDFSPTELAIRKFKTGLCLAKSRIRPALDKAIAN